MTREENNSVTELSYNETGKHSQTNMPCFDVNDIMLTQQLLVFMVGAEESFP